MTCIGSFLCRARRTTATIALIAGAFFVMSVASAAPAAAQGSQGQSESWLSTLWPGGSSLFPSEYQEPRYVGAAAKKKSADGEKVTEVRKGSGKDSTDDLFRSDPQYEGKYDPKSNVDIYGAKVDVETPRPIFELGRPQYTSGAYEESSTILGALNPLVPGLAVYGDWRTAVAFNRNNGRDVGQIATRVNVDVDFKITGTERIHAFFTPLQRNNRFTRYEFSGGDGDGRLTGEFDLNPQTLFFEGDLGSIYSGLSGKQAGFDLPFTFGLFPLFLQNGIWANDAILGGAVSIPAKNSAALGLANFDITLFAGFDNVDNPGILGVNKRHANIYGITTFIDAFSGYIEAGYGLLEGTRELEGQYTNFVTAAYSRRYANTISNSTRVFANFGNGANDDGFAIISENSLITRLPSTLIPYANFFVGVGNPQPLVDGFNAGILKNVGINFETDALTGFPKLNDTAADAWGGAIGLQYLFNLDQQLVFEAAMVQPFGNSDTSVQEAQYGLGVRYQIALNHSWILRADATYQFIEGREDNFGVRTELRRKF